MREAPQFVWPRAPKYFNPALDIANYRTPDGWLTILIAAMAYRVKSGLWMSRRLTDSNCQI
jgi:hypothetical protein